MGGCPYTKKTIDIRMGIKFAGENLFSLKIEQRWFWCYWWDMKEGKYEKLNISLPPDLHKWIKKKQADFKKENPLGKLEISPIVAHCIKAMKDAEESAQKSSSKPSNVAPPVIAKGKAAPPERAGVLIDPGLETSATLSSTHTKKRSPKTG